MKCRDGTHRYKPFPRSRDLYCEFCGDEPSRPRVASTFNEYVRETAPVQEELPLDEDPDAQLARQIIDDQRLKTAEQRVRVELEATLRKMIAAENLPADQAEELLREAMDFGPDIDLDKFSELIGTIGASHRPEPDATDLIP